MSRNYVFLSSGDRDLGVAFKVQPGSQALSRFEAKNSTLLSSCDGHLPGSSPGRSREFKGEMASAFRIRQNYRYKDWLNKESSVRKFSGGKMLNILIYVES